MFVEQDGKFFRMRRGKLVEIPRQWLHQVPSKSTMSDRRVAAKMKRHGRKHNTQANVWPSQKTSPIIRPWSLADELEAVDAQD